MGIVIVAELFVHSAISAASCRASPGLAGRMEPVMPGPEPCEQRAERADDDREDDEGEDVHGASRGLYVRVRGCPSLRGLVASTVQVPVDRIYVRYRYQARRRSGLLLLEVPAEYCAPAALRRCSRCGEAKPIDDFPMKIKERGLRRVWCRGCCRAYGREHYRRNRPTYLAKADRRNREERGRAREQLISYLRAHPCMDCGETDITLLDFDHRDASTKRGTISRLIHTTGWMAAQPEITKCDVRCANCHRRRTSKQLNWRKDPMRGALSAATIAAIGPVLTRPSSTGRPVIDQLSIWQVGVVKRCYKCGREKAVHEFSLRRRETGERQGFCRSCQAASRRAHYARNRDKYIARALVQMRQRWESQVRLLHDYLLVHPCVDCDEARIEVLEFDHIDPRTKTREISFMLGRRVWDVIFTEMQKCDVVCANCHRRRTASQQGWLKRLGEDATGYARMTITRE